MPRQAYREERRGCSRELRRGGRFIVRPLRGRPRLAGCALAADRVAGVVDRGAHGAADRADRILQVLLRLGVTERPVDRAEGLVELIADLSGRLLELALGLLRALARARLLVVVRQVSSPRREPLADLVPCILRVLAHHMPPVDRSVPSLR